MQEFAICAAEAAIAGNCPPPLGQITFTQVSEAPDSAYVIINWQSMLHHDNTISNPEFAPAGQILAEKVAPKLAMPLGPPTAFCVQIEGGSISSFDAPCLECE
jgi:hypothetical protein